MTERKTPASKVCKKGEAEESTKSLLAAAKQLDEMPRVELPPDPEAILDSVFGIDPSDPPSHGTMMGRRVSINRPPLQPVQ